MTPVYTWAPLDLAPLDSLTVQAGQLLGAGADDLRAGRALLNRAPAPLLTLWEAGHLSTYAAYAVLRTWEAGELPQGLAAAFAMTAGAA